ncbi:MAG: D-alanyl-D-alanine-carboxypeptidase/D-alanyl-D-alanine-endopeptidase [Mariniblastus sp.]|jgi:D-alanyl-D-alanine-carboxypeptidase/D-alanyl-D-alanine-endopeptidase
MRMSIRSCVLCPLLFCLASTVVIPITVAQEGFQHEAKINALVKPYLKANKFNSASVGVVIGDQVWIGNFGQLSDGQSKPPTGDTIYEIGSISKVFTAILLADAVAKGDVKLTTSIGELMPAIKDSELGNSITLKHLSTHTSGLPRMPSNLRPKDPNNPFDGYDRAKLTEFMKSVDAPKPVGENYAYSNLGAGLLGDLLAAQSKSSYEALLNDRLLSPFGMSDTALKLSADQETRFAPPHNSALVADHAWDFDAMAGAGAIRSTTRDMIKFMKMNINPPTGDVGQAINLAWEKQLTKKTGRPAMGLGWHFSGDDSTRWHNGRTGGYQSMMLVNRKLKAGVVLLSNTAGSDIDGLAESIFQAVVGMNPKPKKFNKAVSVDQKVLDRLAGKYELAPQVIIEVVANKGRLTVKLTGQTFLKVVPESDTVWNYTDVEAQLRFDLPNKGPAKKVTLHQNGQKMPAPRIKD